MATALPGVPTAQAAPTVPVVPAALAAAAAGELVLVLVVLEGGRAVAMGAVPMVAQADRRRHP